MCQQKGHALIPNTTLIIQLETGVEYGGWDVFPAGFSLGLV